MTARGVAPTPTAIKKLRGNPGRRPLNNAEAQFEVPSRVPNVPDFLGPMAVEIWSDLGRMLLDAGLFTRVDKYALGMFAAAAGRWMEAESKIEESGGPVLTGPNGGIYQNPWLSVSNKAWDQMYKLFGDFGLSPAERARLPVHKDQAEMTLAEKLFAMAAEKTAKTAVDK